METGDFSTIESMSFAFSVSGFDVVANQCVLVWRDIDVNQDFISAAVQPQATTTLSVTHMQSANMISDDHKWLQQHNNGPPFDSFKLHMSGDTEFLFW